MMNDGAFSDRLTVVQRARMGGPCIRCLLALAWFSLLPLTSHAQDRVRPTLIGSTPPNNAAGVDPATPFRFVFGEPMKSQQQILWITSPVMLSSNAVVYAWSTDGRELTASLPTGWPANQRISWIFQPNLPAIPGITEGVQSFQDLAGNPLSGGVGSFTTSAGGPPPIILTTNFCGIITTNLTRSILSLVLSARYAQTNEAGPPIPLMEAGAKPFTAIATVSPGVGSATSVLLSTPAGSGLNLTNRAGLFSRTDSFDSQDALARAYPPGTYRFVATGVVGDIPSQAEVNQPALGWPMLRVANFDFLQGVPGTNAVPIVWDSIAGTTQDIVRIVVRPISSPNTIRWSSPDPGCPGAINATETGVSYQLFELLMTPEATHSTPGRRPGGDPVATPVGQPVIASGTNTEFSLPLDPTTRSRVFGVGRSGRGR